MRRLILIAAIIVLGGCTTVRPVAGGPVPVESRAARGATVAVVTHAPTVLPGVDAAGAEDSMVRGENVAPEGVVLPAMPRSPARERHPSTGQRPIMVGGVTIVVMAMAISQHSSWSAMKRTGRR